MGGPVLWKQGSNLSGYFLLNWDGEGALGFPLLLASSLRVLISSVHLRVSNIFHGQLQLYISLLSWHCMLQSVDLCRDEMDQTIDNTWSNHKQHQYGDNKDQQGHQPTPNFPSPGGSSKERLQPPQELSSSFFEILQALNVFLRTVRLSLTQLEVFTQKQQVSFKMAQVPPCSGIKRSILYLFWITTPAKLCQLFRAVLRSVIPRNLILGVFIRMALICSPEQVSEISQGLTGVLSVLFCFLPRA